MPEHDTLIIGGLPGCGKGTQGALMQKHHAPTHIFSASEIIGRHLASHKELKTQFQSFIDAGKLVPDELVMPIIDEYINPFLEKASEAHVIIDGYPRTPGQAKHLAEILERHQRKESAKVFHLTLGENPEEEAEVVLARTKNRYVCSGPERHIWSADQVKELSCPLCNAGLERRQDDQEEKKVRERIREYADYTIPALKYLAKEGGIPMKKVNGLLKREEVHEEIMHELGAARYTEHEVHPAARK